VTGRRPLPRGFGAVWMAVAVDLLGFGIVIPLLPLYAESFDASPAVIGALFASYSLAQFVFSPIWGRLSDRVGRRPVLLVTIAGSMIGSLVLGLAGSIAGLFVGRIVDGASGASVGVARAVAADVAEPSERPRLMGLLGAAFGLGFVIGPVIGAISVIAGPSVPYFVAAGLSLVNLVVGVIRLPETREPGEAGVQAEERPVRLVMIFVLVSFVAITAFSAFEATFPLLADRRLALDEGEIALVFAAIGVVLVATQGGLVGILGRRLDDVVVIRLGLVANIVGFVLLAVADSWPPLAVGLASLAVGQGLVTPALSSAIAAATAPGTSGVALGYQQSAGGLARVVGPLLGGWLFAVGISLPYWVTAAIAMAAVTITFVGVDRQPDGYSTMA
jgi:DHA1 family tetracycline resistance protein-like MFS transporter